MREHGIGHTRRRRRSLTKPDTTAVPAPDLIGRDFTAQAPGQRLVGDITYLPTAEGWLYLATTIDLYNREVVGYAIAEHMRAELVCDAVTMAHRAGLIDPDAIMHSDRGSQYACSQYASTEYRAALQRIQMRASVGRVGSCYDNAVAESFFANLKSEIGARVWAARAEARRAVFAYITYYNRRRLHSTLKQRTPYETRVCYRQTTALAA
jgi:transposase InsO family protein